MGKADSTIYALMKSMQTQTNMLGQEVNAVGRSIGDEDTGAALNLATMGAVLTLGAVAGGIGFALDHKDKLTKSYYVKALEYGGLGDPMDENGAVLPEHKLLAKLGMTDAGVNRNERGGLKDGFKMQYRTSLQNLNENIRSSQDTLVQRHLISRNLWDSFLFCQQCNKNHLFFAVDGNWPPSMQVNLVGVSDEKVKELQVFLAKHDVKLTASTAAGNQQIYNLGGSYEALSKVADKLENGSLAKDLNIEANIIDINGEGDVLPLSEAIREHRDKYTLRLEASPGDKDLKILEDYSKNFGAKFEEATVNFSEFEIKPDQIATFKVNTGDKFNLTNIGGKIRIQGKVSDLKGLNPETFAGIPGFADKIKDAASGVLKTTMAVSCPTGFDGLMKLMFVAGSRLGGSWGDGTKTETIKQQIRTWAQTGLEFDPRRTNLNLYYGEKSGGAKFDRTLHSLVMDEEMAQLFNLNMKDEAGNPTHAFFDEKGNCKVVNLLDREKATAYARQQNDAVQAIAELLKSNPAFNTGGVPMGH